jgi:hypothetical protein
VAGDVLLRQLSGTPGPFVGKHAQVALEEGRADFSPLAQVLHEAVKECELREEEATRAAKDILFQTANRVYLLALEAQRFPS